MRVKAGNAGGWTKDENHNVALLYMGGPCSMSHLGVSFLLLVSI